jgi:hypothetical protein
VIEDWRAMLSNAEPLRSQALSAYLTGVYRDADEIN